MAAEDSNYCLYFLCQANSNRNIFVQMLTYLIQNNHMSFVSTRPVKFITTVSQLVRLTFVSTEFMATVN